MTPRAGQWWSWLREGPSWEGYSAAFFADFGNVWLLDAPITVTSQTEAARAVFDPLLRVGLGAGLRVGTPVGRGQVDFASDAAVQKRPREDWEEPSFRLHLSLGTLF